MNKRAVPRTPRLPIEVVRQIDAVSDEYESSIRGVDAPPIGGYLSRVASIGRGRLLAELTALLFERLRQEGVTDPVTTILKANADLAPEIEALLAEHAATLAEGSSHSPPADALHVKCPHCHEPIELIHEADLRGVSCPSCGSGFNLIDDSEAARGYREGARLGHFELVDRVGAGAFGSVWKARDTKLDRTVAIKIPRQRQLDELQQRGFFREAQNAAQLNHPGIVPVHEVGRDGDTLFLVSDFVEGVTLGDWLACHEPSVRESVELVVKVAEAVHHAHERGVIHRDLKPTNIMIEDGRNPRLMDFGLAKRDATEITVSVDGRLIGTPSYMSPEQAQGDSVTTDPRSDIYSLGVVLFQLLTRELPFRGNTRMLLQQVIHDDPPSPRRLAVGVPRDLETICLKCLEKSPSKRYATAKELAEELRRHLRVEPILTRPPTLTYKVGKFVSRNRVPVTVGCAFLASLLAAVCATSVLYLRAKEAESSALANERKAEKARREAVSESNRVKSLLDVVVSSIASVNSWEHGQVQRGSAAGMLLRMQERVLSEPMPEVPLTKASLLAAIGNTLMGLGHHVDAIPGHEECLELRTAQLPPDHKDVLRVMSNLAICYREQGGAEDNEELIKKAKAIDKEVIRRAIDAFGINDRFVLNALACAADDLKTIEEASTRADSDLGPADEAALRLKHNLAVEYAQRGQPTPAIELYRQLVQLRQDEPEAKKIILLGNLGAACHAAGERHESREVLEKTYRLCLEWLGPDQPYTHSWAASCLQGVLLDQGAYEQAEAVSREWLDSVATSTRRNPTHKAWAKVSLSAALLGQGKLAEAQSMSEQALAEPRISGVESERAKSVLGACLIASNTTIGVGNKDRAEKLLLEAFRALEKRLAREKFDERELPYKRFYVPNACQRVIDMYRLRGDAEKTRQWQRKLASVQSQIAEYRAGNRSTN